MLKRTILALCILANCHANAQVQISKLVGKNSDAYTLGYGGFLKFGYPVSNAADVSLEVGANIFTLKADKDYGWITIPIKAGYRYTFNQTGSGIYAQPQLGYNVGGVDPADKKFSGLVYAMGVGYLFKPSKVQFDISLLFESVAHTGGAANYMSLRLTHNFSFRKREEE